MTIGSLVSLMRGSVWQVFKLAAPVLGTALVVGLIIAIFQATTSIQEQTLTFLPKFVTILVVIALLSGFMFQDLKSYTEQLFALIPALAI